MRNIFCWKVRVPPRKNVYPNKVASGLGDPCIKLGNIIFWRRSSRKRQIPLAPFSLFPNCYKFHYGIFSFIYRVLEKEYIQINWWQSALKNTWYQSLRGNHLLHIGLGDTTLFSRKAIGTSFYWHKVCSILQGYNIDFAKKKALHTCINDPSSEKLWCGILHFTLCTRIQDMLPVRLPPGMI
jgi:hypothetical protein